MPTVLHRLNRWVETDPEAVAQRYKNKTWKSISARELMDRIYYLALFLESRGISAKDAGCIYSTNCPQWVATDLAVLLLGAKSAGVYPNSTQKDVLYILNHTEASVLAVQNAEFFRKITGEKGEGVIPDRVKLILTFDLDSSFHPRAVTYEAAIAAGKKLSTNGGGKKLQAYLDAIDPNAGCILIYTSGTTGNPKGALLTHDNLTFTSDLAAKYWKLPMGEGSLFSFLPLCHIAEKLQNVGVGISQRYVVNYCTKFDNLMMELPEIQPTLLLCVPRLWEKMMEGVLHKVDRSPPLRKKLAHWALQSGAKVAEAKFSGRFPSPVDLVKFKLADRLVLRKVRQALGLGQAQVLASGAAALPAQVSRWFRSLALEILEDFGQTESTGVICMTQRGVESAGTVGKGVPGIEVKIAEDGEILTRGRHVFKGYYKDDAATAQALEGGWLHTGDLGEVTAQGLIRIRGRKKEILKTSGGKMVAPLPIEEALKTSPIISQVCVVGDGRKYLSALMTLSESALEDLKSRPGALDNRVIKHSETVDKVKEFVDGVNQSLASFEQIKRFSILSREFSIADGEMTPTLKMKRNVIEDRYREVIDQMYS